MTAATSEAVTKIHATLARADWGEGEEPPPMTADRDREIALSLGARVWLCRWQERETPEGRWDALGYYLDCLDREARAPARRAG